MNDDKIHKNQPYGSDDQWFAIKAEIKNLWDKMTDDEIDNHRHDHENLASLIHSKYDHTKDEVSIKLKNILTNFGPTTEDIKKMTHH
jgi:uncharacterized protein YjbJ (UPF0337 family)